MIAARRRRPRNRNPGTAMIFVVVCGPVAVGALLAGASLFAVLAAVAVMALAVWVAVAVSDRGRH